MKRRIKVHTTDKKHFYLEVDIPYGTELSNEEYIDEWLYEWVCDNQVTNVEGWTWP